MKSKLLYLLIALSMVIGFLPGTVPALATPAAVPARLTVAAATTPPPGKIAFVSNRDGNLEIYSMNATDGSGQTRLTSNSAYDSMPVPSPDDSKIAFVSNRDGNREIYVMSANGAGVTQLTVTDNASNEWPAWSPDGSRIAFASDRDDGYNEIYTMNSNNGSGLMPLTNNSTGANYPAWSSTGKIAFVSHPGGGYGEIYVMDADGTNQTRLTNNPAPDNFPAWSPDGSKIAFPSNRTGNMDIYVMNIDSSNLTQLTSNSAEDWQPQWGPDGTKIAFSTNRDGNWEVYRMDANGANQVSLSNNSANDWLRGKWEHPSVVTSGSGNITSSSAVLSGNLTDLGSRGKVKVSFQWGLTAGNYTGATPVVSMNATGSFSANVAGLSANTTYHFRARAGGDGRDFGADGTFTTAAPAVPVAYWTFDNDTTNDTVGSNHGTIVGSGVTFTTGKVGRAISFSGSSLNMQISNQYVEIPSLNLPAITVEAWVNSSHFGYYTSMVTKSYYPDAWNSPWNVWTLMFSENTPNPGFFPFVASPDPAAMGQWIHLAGTHDGVTAKLYVNGVEKASVPVSGPLPSTSGKIYIGPPKAANHGYQGLIDEVAIWDRALSATDIQQHYQNGLNGQGYLPPTITTDNATNITTNSAILNGTLTSLGSAANVSLSFDWGTTSGTYTNSTTSVSVNATGAFSANLTGLSANTTYHFRAKAVGDGVGLGAERSFTTAAAPSELSPPEDMALNPSGTGYPHPLESDAGWGGGALPWEIIDGKRYYPGEWAHGLAFTGGSAGWGGQPAGWRQATINFGEPKTFNRVVVWHHGLEHVPNTYKIQYWDGTSWVDIFSTTNGRAYLKYPADPPTNWWESETPTENVFNPVTSTKVRFALWNGDITHGWIYEFEVYNDGETVKPDLIISEKHEEWVVPGVSYKVSYTIKNSGNATAPAGHDVALQVDGNFIESKPVPVSLAPGDNYTDNFTSVINLSGSYDSVRVDADFNNEVEESDETNNRLLNTFAWPPAPDLYIPNKYEEWVQQGTQYQVHFTILNRGNGPTPAGHDTQLKIDGTVIETKPVPVLLNPGESYQDVFSYTANLTGGVDKVVVTADINSEVPEPNETNNTYENTIAWPPAPDLVVGSKSEQWVAGQSDNYTVRFSVRNIGNAVAPAGHDVQLKVDGTVIETVTIPVDLSPGSFYSGASFATVVTISGSSDNITVTADINNEVAESDETNNYRTNTWSAIPDLTITEKHEVWVVAGSQYIVSFTIKNNGSVSVPSGHDVSLWVDNKFIEQKPVPVSLAPSENYTDNFTTIINLSSSSDSLYVYADINNEVDESNETNNRRWNMVAWPPAPELTTYKWEEWVQQGTQYLVHFRVSNSGNAPAPAGHDVSLLVDGVELEQMPIGVTLNPAESYSGNFTSVVTLTGGMDKVKVTADINNVVIESSETNNYYENTIAWPPAPDLIVSGKREQWLPGSTTQYNVYFDLRNIGNAPAPAGHHVQLMVDGVVQGTVLIPVTINQGSTYYTGFPTPITISGGYDTITLTADINNEVAESDETNNTRSNTWSAAWQTVRSPTGILADVTFVDTSNGWAVGSGGTILHTSDGGSTWTLQKSGTTSDLWNVSFVDANNGWTVGSGGTIRHTADGGTTWTSQPSGISNTLYGVSFVDANNGWAAGAGGTIVRTSNGGSTWVSQTSNTTNSLYGVSFVDASNGWAVGNSGTILHTSNGGSTWTAQTSNTTNTLSEADFVDASNGWAVGAGGSSNGTILHTSDGGATWTAKSDTTTNILTAVDFFDVNNGWAVGSNGRVLHTSNGGATWTSQNSNTFVDNNNGWGVNLAGVISLSANQAWVVGGAMTRLYTTDGGANWIVQNQAAPQSYQLRGVDFVSSLEGWAVGRTALGKDFIWGPGMVLHTIDGGANWTVQTSNTILKLDGVSFVDSNNGWAVGGNIIHTSNSVASWTLQTSNTTNNLNSVSFVDANNGWTVGSSGTILGTSDGGTTWTTQNSTVTNSLNSVSFVDANNGWAVGSSGTILYTSDGGNTWTAQNSGTTNTLNSVSFVDTNNGWAVGSSGIILRTSNGGSTWAAQTSGTGSSLYGVSFVNATNGWTVGSSGRVLYTSDGGSTWIAQTSNTTNSLRGVSATDSNHAWAVGDYGIIIRYETALPAPVVEVSINAPAKVAPGRGFTAKVEISQVQSLDAANYDVSFNSAVLRLDNVTSGNIAGVTVPVDTWSQRQPGRFTIVVNVPGFTGATGSGYLAVLHFYVIGSLGQSSDITLSSGVLSSTLAQEMPATWLGDFVEVALVPGDANGDGLVNAVDITKVERIIAGLDSPTPGADANQDGLINAIDITKVERIIVGLD